MEATSASENGACKKRKLSNCADSEVSSTDQLEVEVKAPGGLFSDFGGFECERILLNNADQKRVTIQGRVKGETALVILDKKPFTDQSISELFTENACLEHTFQNDIYGSYDCFPTPLASTIKTTIVFPATQKHIEKYEPQNLLLIDETKDIYENVTSVYLKESTFDIKWVFNILEHKKEADRIVFEDPDPQFGFILLPDLKWDGIVLESLYLVAIVHPKGIKSLRDLREEHLPLLENVLNAGSKAIKEKYGVKKSQLRIYIHYQPSYYHLHIHFTALRFNAPGIFTEKSHLLQTVINNIKSSGNYYEQATLPFVIREKEALYQKLTEYGYEF